MLWGPDAFATLPTKSLESKVFQSTGINLPKYKILGTDEICNFEGSLKHQDGKKTYLKHENVEFTSSKLKIYTNLKSAFMFKGSGKKKKGNLNVFEQVINVYGSSKNSTKFREGLSKIKVNFEKPLSLIDDRLLEFSHRSFSLRIELTATCATQRVALKWCTSFLKSLIPGKDMLFVKTVDCSTYARLQLRALSVPALAALDVLLESNTDLKLHPTKIRDHLLTLAVCSSLLDPWFFKGDVRGSVSHLVFNKPRALGSVDGFGVNPLTMDTHNILKILNRPSFCLWDSSGVAQGFLCPLTLRLTGCSEMLDYDEEMNKIFTRMVRWCSWRASKEQWAMFNIYLESCVRLHFFPFDEMGLRYFGMAWMQCYTRSLKCKIFFLNNGPTAEMRNLRSLDGCLNEGNISELYGRTVFQDDERSLYSILDSLMPCWSKDNDKSSYDYWLELPYARLFRLCLGKYSEGLKNGMTAEAKSAIRHDMLCSIVAQFQIGKSELVSAPTAVLRAKDWWKVDSRKRLVLLRPAVFVCPDRPNAYPIKKPDEERVKQVISDDKNIAKESTAISL